MDVSLSDIISLLQTQVGTLVLIVYLFSEFLIRQPAKQFMIFVKLSKEKEKAIINIIAYIGNIILGVLLALLINKKGDIVGYVKNIGLLTLLPLFIHWVHVTYLDKIIKKKYIKDK